MSTVEDIEVQFPVPAMDVHTGTYGKVVLTAVLQTVPAETIIYNEELRQYIENVKLEVSESVQKITQDLSVDVTGRLGYRFTVNSQAGTSYTLALADEGTLVRMTSSQDNEVIVPDEATVPFEEGTIVNLRRSGIGVTTVVAAEGVTINTPDLAMKIDDMNLGVGLVKVGPDEWDLVKSFTGVPMGEVEQLVEDIEYAINSLDDAQSALDAKITEVTDSLSQTVANIEQTLSQTINQAVQNAEQAIANLGDVTNLSQFGNIKGGNGYQRLPNGLIFQWGTVNSPPRHRSSDPTTIVKFPIPFPTAVFQVQISHNTPSAYSNKAVYETGIGVHSFNNTQVRIEHYDTGDKTGTVVAYQVYWFAIGH